MEFIFKQLYLAMQVYLLTSKYFSSIYTKYYVIIAQVSISIVSLFLVSETVNTAIAYYVSWKIIHLLIAIFGFCVFFHNWVINKLHWQRRGFLNCQCLSTYFKNIVYCLVTIFKSFFSFEINFLLFLATFLKGNNSFFHSFFFSV